MNEEVLIRTDVPGYPVRRGKVRDIYDLGDSLIIVSTDRISAFDWVLANGIPGKGRILTEMTRFWLERLRIPHHLLSTDVADVPTAFRAFDGRVMLVKKARVVPVECVARGYLAGSAWKEYRAHQTICGVELPPGLKEADQLPEPIFTPATKAEEGHDENITFDETVVKVGHETAAAIRDRTLDVYNLASNYAARRNIILADTKLEWGRLPSGELILVDEVLTPDSSRFWPSESYKPGANPPSFDKQYIRDWLESCDWDKNSPPPRIPPDVALRTAEKYREALARLTG